jgi:geranylgeranyl diphosphate synthase type II
MDFIQRFERYKHFADECIMKYLPKPKQEYEILAEAMEYALLGGGKRIRPVLLLAVCEMCGGTMQSAGPAAAAIEMVHAYSLVHDDLPAMDNDDFRRGRPTVHKKFGDDIAILAGDALLTRAFEAAAQIPDETSALQSSLWLARGAGCEGMVAGQVIDLLSEGKDGLTYEHLRQMDLLKTGALIRTAGRIGGIIGGASEQELSILDHYCSSLGLAFQIQDDILDVTGSEEFGKPIGSDAENGKATYVTILGLAQAKEYSSRLTGVAVEAAGKLCGGEFLTELAFYLLHRNQ